MKRSPQLDRYKQLVGEELLARIYRAASPLAGVHVLHLNTTAEGGGVAELLHSLLPLMEELGIPHTWKVIPLDGSSSLFAAHLVDLLQGIEHGDIPQADQRTFLERLSDARGMLQAAQNRADLYFVHDFQLAPLATLFPRIRPALWMCHVDTANPDPGGRHISINFLVLITSSGIDTTRPLITQVSRFGNWKNPWQVIDVYHLVKQELPSVQVALVGAMEAADDIKAMEILKDIQERAGADPDIHLLYDPDVITHPIVNAFQRYSSVILQRSIREGFGLTVTEAMWKYEPVVGTSVTGLRAQIIDGQNGYIADSTEACAQCTLKLLEDRELWRQLGKQAHEQVRKHYLFPAMVLQYLDRSQKLVKCPVMGEVLRKVAPATCSGSQCA